MVCAPAWSILGSSELVSPQVAVVPLSPAVYLEGRLLWGGPTSCSFPMIVCVCECVRVRKRVFVFFRVYGFGGQS